MSHEAGLVQLNEAFGEKNRPSSGPIKAKQRFIKTESSWWFQPIWKILVKMEIFPKEGWT